MNDRFASPRVFAAAGALLSVISAFLPWFKVASLTEVDRISPATAPYVRASAWLVCVALLVGALIVLVKGTPLVVGCAGALWFNVALITWFLGSKTSSVLPKDLLPENFTVRLQPGVILALGASLLLLMSSLMLLSDHTWDGQQERVHGWSIPVGIVISVMLLAVREVTWIRLDTFDFGWNLTVDAVPFLGDLLLVLFLIGAIIAVATAFAERLWLMVASVVTGVGIVVLGLLSWLLEDTLVDVGGWIARRADFLQGKPFSLDSSIGPFFTVAVGLVLSSYGAALLLHRMHRDGGLGDGSRVEAGGMSWSGSQVVSAPEAPF